MKVMLRVDGGAQLATALRSLSKRLSNKLLAEALVAAGEPMRAVASSLAPRAPGAPDMADHIEIQPMGASRRKATAGDVEVAIGPTTGFFYGHYQEYGTRRHGAQSFLRPALDREATATIQRMSGHVWRALISRGVTTSRGGGGSGGAL